MHRIFIVEDDAAIAAALQKHLTTWGFDVRCAEDFRNVLAECTAFDPQLVLLDITLPFYNGYHWCQELRRVSNVPVVFISSASDNMNIYRILQTLLERKGSVVSRETLMEKLWETDSFVDENTLTVNIARLRRKLEAAGLSDYITTKKGLGYLIE